MTLEVDFERMLRLVQELKKKFSEEEKHELEKQAEHKENE